MRLMPSPAAMIEDLGLSARSFNALYNLGYRTVRDLEDAYPGDLLRAKNFGKISLEEVRVKLREYGVWLRGDCRCAELKRLLRWTLFEGQEVFRMRQEYIDACALVGLDPDNPQIGELSDA